MNMFRYRPSFTEANSLHSALGTLFNEFDLLRPSEPYGASNSQFNKASDYGWVPAVDIQEQDRCFFICVDVPGVDAKDIDIDMEEQVLSIKGKRSPNSKNISSSENESVSKIEHEGYLRIERAKGGFQRSFKLPDTANTEAISASCTNGVLEITIPKHTPAQARKIQIEQ